MFFGMIGDDIFRKAYSFIPQSTVADLLNLNLVAIHYALKDKADILLQVHDSILMQCRFKDLEEVIKVSRQFLERPFKINGQSCVIPVVEKAGLSWGEMMGRDEEGKFNIPNDPDGKNDPGRYRPG